MTSDVGPLVSGAVGLLGVAVGLTGDLLRRRWQRPRLELLEYLPNDGDAIYFDLFTLNSFAVYVRLRVHNTGRDTAQNVEACVEKIELLDENPDMKRYAMFQRQPPEGIIGRRLKWADREESVISIPPGTVRRIDLVNVHTTDPALPQDDGSLAVPLRITLSKNSAIYRNILAGLSYRLTISLTAENSRAAFFSFALRFGGKWIGEDLLKPDKDGGVIIDELRAGGPPA